jgi:hypothetical protein
MDENQLVRLVDTNPSVIKAYTGFTHAGAKPLLKPPERFEAIKRHVPLVLDRINLSVDMDFNTDMVEMVSVADTAVYQCVGNSGDCRDIITVSYGATLDTCTPLNEFTPTDGDDFQAEGSFVGVVFWQHAKRKSDFPQFELRGTPSEAGVMKVRYRLRTPDIAEFPSTLDLLLEWGLLAEIAPHAFEEKYSNMLALLVSRHQGAGREYKRVRMDPDIQDKQAYYASIRGYGG